MIERIPSPLAGEGQGEGKDEGRGGFLPPSPSLPRKGGEGQCLLPLVTMRGIAKRFGTVQAIDGVDLSLNAGDILGLLGENGAGKTSLMNVLFGTYAPDDGTIEIDGRPVTIRNSADALALGIGMVHQHFELVPRHTVLENLLVGRAGPDGALSRRT